MSSNTTKKQRVSSGATHYPWDMNWVKRALAVAERRGKNRSDLARVLGKNRGYLGKIEKGVSRPLLEDVLKIAEVLGVSMDYLLTEDMPWLDPSEKEGVSGELDRGSDAILRLVSALGISSEEAMRRLVPVPASSEYFRLAASRDLAHTEGDAGGGELLNQPVGKPARVKRSG